MSIYILFLWQNVFHFLNIIINYKVLQKNGIFHKNYIVALILLGKTKKISNEIFRFPSNNCPRNINKLTKREVSNEV